jgi:predicted nucleotidyltransferase
LLGSTARGDATQNSDVDRFFDHSCELLGRFKSMDIKQRAASILRCNTNMMTRRSLHPVLAEPIEAAARQGFCSPDARR